MVPERVVGIKPSEAGSPESRGFSPKPPRSRNHLGPFSDEPAQPVAIGTESPLVIQVYALSTAWT